MPKEIERRFHLVQLPEDFELHPWDHVQQGYTAIDLANGFEERVRYRRTPNRAESYARFHKRGRGRDRTEVETPISVNEFQSAMASCLGDPITKRVYAEQWRRRWMELHIFRSHPPLMTIEVEFSTEEDAGRFLPPDWFGKEVTDDPRYNSAGIALFGVPPDFHPSDELMALFFPRLLLVEP